MTYDTRKTESFTPKRGRKTRWTHTEIHDWIVFVPMSHGAKVTYLILRSMCLEKEDEGIRAAEHAPTRSLTIDRLCWLASNALGKPVGERTVRDYRNELEKADLLEIQPGRIPSDPPSYLLHDLPVDSYAGWRNGWAVDDAYPEGSDWRGRWKKDGQTPLRSTAPCDTPQGANGSNPPADDRTLRTTAGSRRHTAGSLRSSAGSRRHTAEGPGTDLRESAPKKAFKKASKNPPQEDARAGARESAEQTRDPWLEEEGSAAPRTLRSATPLKGAGDMRPAQRGRPRTAPVASPLALAPSAEAMETAAQLDGLIGGEVAEAAEFIDKALKLGWTSEIVVEKLRKLYSPAVTQPVGFYRTKIGSVFLCADPNVVLKRKGSNVIDFNRCPDCQGQGWVVEGDLPGDTRCDHRRLKACPDCEGGGRLADRSYCRHENAPKRVTTEGGVK